MRCGTDMFTVYDKHMFDKTRMAKEVQVYDVAYDKSGYPLFLVKQNGECLKMSAKYFLTKDEVYGRYIE